ncbi:hypothetical protein NDU88_004119, partial [Pleurodeles waltl]
GVKQDALQVVAVGAWFGGRGAGLDAGELAGLAGEGSVGASWGGTAAPGDPASVECDEGGGFVGPACRLAAVGARGSGAG